MRLQGYNDDEISGVHISIHAPARGATTYELDSRPYQSVFQSTHPRGVRPGYYIYQLKNYQFQSTHPRGVRQPMSWILDLINLYFNPRTREGCDYLKIRLVLNHLINFNPRTREGCDLDKEKHKKAGKVFQSTHPRGVRPKLPLVFSKYFLISIHAPARGATRKGRPF